VAALVAGEHARALVQVVDERLFAVLPAVGEEDVRELSQRVAARLEPYSVVGVSSLHAEPADLRRALEEAELLCDVARNGGPGARDAAGRGAYRLLARLLASHPDELRAFYEETVASAVRHDEQYRTDLVKTLTTYLACDCNMNATAAAIHAHRHTIAYRLERIQELTGLDPTRSEDRERLGIGLKAHELLAPRLPR
jgi:DNA-binding PucR family transcriptional regulator